jgi:hypothetical protein
MLKKIVLGTLFIGFIGVLIYGAILRTDAKTSSGDAEGHGSGTGLGRGRANTEEETDVAYSRGQRQGRGQTARATSEQSVDVPELEQDIDSQSDRAAERQTVEGTVISVGAQALVVERVDGHQILVEGRAWTYALEQGFDVQIGNVVSVMGFLEDGEFKAGSLENLTTGQRMAVRDTNGRPLWSGGGRGSA